MPSRPQLSLVARAPHVRSPNPRDHKPRTSASSHLITRTPMHEATATAPVNIATLKYWGKRDITLNLPTNSSISVTLAQADLRATTTARASSTFKEDALFLNGAREPLGARTLAVLGELRAARRALPDGAALADLPLQIVSENNFPTAAGLASSAAGFAALVYAVAQLYALPADASALSVLARQGSGSACRSLFGGYVAWHMGEKTDGSDSRAVQIAGATHWPGMRALILVACADKKDVPSSSGMQRTVETSPLFQYRIKEVVPPRFARMTQAILARDFPTFAELTMADSNEFHAVCLDSYPPIFYMNDVSRAAVKAVEQLNAKLGRVAAAYTFDAGPNCVVYYEEADEPAVLAHFAPAVAGAPGFPVAAAAGEPRAEPERWAAVLSTGILRVIHTRVGPGPQVLNEHLPAAAI